MDYINGLKVLYTCKRDHMDVSMIEGCKSGYTSDAQHTLSSMINVNNHHYICVVGYSKIKMVIIIAQLTIQLL